MATNTVHEHGTDYLKVIASAAHLAGDLVYEKGFFGVCEDNVASGQLFTLRLSGTFNLPRVPSTLAMGTQVSAGPSSVATTLVIIGGPTTGAIPFGRTIATGTASTAKIQLYNPRQTSAA